MRFAHKSKGINDYMPSVSQRYHQMLMPGLRLVAGISASLESKHDSAVKQVCRDRDMSQIGCE